MVETRIGICRLCTAHCPIEVTVEEGRAVRVVGDRRSDVYGGYSCRKGRALPEFLNAPNRLRHSMKRRDDGSYVAISHDDAIDEIAERLRRIVDEHGPRAVAGYLGTATLQKPTMGPLAAAFLLALGTPLIFSALTLDKPGDLIAHAHHGTWLGGENLLETSDTWVLLGTNPIVSHEFFAENPVGRITRAVRNGNRLVVIDPRRTETARHAHVHLQPRPGEDVMLLAGILHLVLERGAIDREFVAANVAGVDALRAAVAPFTPDVVAARADVALDDLRAAADVIASARTGGVYCGTGVSMTNLGGSLAFYLGLALHSVRGWWAGAGDPFLRPNVLMPAIRAVAQPRAPFSPGGSAAPMRVRGLRGSVAGVPSGALFEEILLDGDGRVRALFNVGGNPLMAFPDSGLAHRALSALDLYVTTDVTLGNNARAADYVIATTMGLETPACTAPAEHMKYYLRGKGVEQPYAHYAPAAAEPPHGADLLDDWQLYYRLAQRLGLQLDLTSAYGIEGAFDVPPSSHPLDMTREPTADELLDILCAGARVSLDEVRRHRHGRVYDAARVTVEPRDDDCAARLDVGAAPMLEELGAVAATLGDGANAPRPAAARPELLLIPRRDPRFVNGTGHDIRSLTRTGRHNPAYMNPDDMADLGITGGDVVDIRSAHGSVQAIAEPEDGLRRGVVSMSHGFGVHPADDDEDPLAHGSNTNRLLSTDAEFDPVTGMPRLGAVPVSVAPARGLRGVVAVAT